VLTNGLDLDSSGRWTDRHLTMPEALVRSLEKEVGMCLILVQTFRFVSSAMRLTTFMTTIRVCPLKSPKVRNPICKGNGTSADSLGHAADVWGAKIEHGENALIDAHAVGQAHNQRTRAEGS
jgi:hypothetical protein